MKQTTKEYIDRKYDHTTDNAFEFAEATAQKFSDSETEIQEYIENIDWEQWGAEAIIEVFNEDIQISNPNSEYEDFVDSEVNNFTNKKVKSWEITKTFRHIDPDLYCQNGQGWSWEEKKDEKGTYVIIPFPCGLDGVEGHEDFKAVVEVKIYLVD